MANQPTQLNTPTARPPEPRRDIPNALALAGMAGLGAFWVVGWVGLHLQNRVVAPNFIWFLKFASWKILGLFQDSGSSYLIYLDQQQPALELLWLVAVLSGVYISSLTAWHLLKNPTNPIIHRRGRQLKTGSESRSELATAAQSEGNGELELILGSGIKISPDRETKHMILTGGTGSGKSTSISHLLVQIIARRDRVLVIDYKGLTQKIPGSVVIIDPADARSRAWAVAKDVTTVWEAREVAGRWITETKDPIWSSGSREILTGLMASLIIENPGKWGFRDLAELIVLDAEAIHQICTKYYPQAARFVDPPDSKSTSDMLKNMNSVAGMVFQAAAAWENRSEFSISNWITNPLSLDRTVILKLSDLFPTMSAAINQSIISTIVSRLSGLPDVGPEKNRVWIVADEFPRLGHVQGWDQMLAVGRSKGLRVLTVVQSISQIRQIFGENETDTWTSIVGTMILGANDGATAEWYCNLIGDQHVWVPQQSVTNSGSGATVSNSYTADRIPVLIPSECTQKLGARKSLGGCFNLLYGFNNVHILFWPFLNAAHGWKNQRPDEVRAAWTLPKNDKDSDSSGSPNTSTTPAVAWVEGVEVGGGLVLPGQAEGQMPAGADPYGLAQANESPEPDSQVEGFGTPISSQTHTVAEFDAVPQILITDSVPSFGTAETQNDEVLGLPELEDETAQHVMTEMVSDMTGISGTGIDLMFELLDEQIPSEAAPVLVPSANTNKKQTRMSIKKLAKMRSLENEQ